MLISRSTRFACTLALAMQALAVSATCIAAEDAAANKAAEARLFATVKYLASDELEGRGLETKGIQAAANYIAAEFRKAGLKSDLYEGGPFEKFQLTVGAKLGPPEQNKLVLTDPTAQDAKAQQIILKLGEDFQTLAVGGSAKIKNRPLVFVGYGITAADLDYDDYAGVDVKDKVVVMLRHEPQQNSAQSKFDGKKPSRHAFFQTKISNAVQHGAAAIIFCTSEAEIRSGAEQVRQRLATALAELESSHAALVAAKHATLPQLEQLRRTIAQQAAEVLKWTNALKKAADPLLATHQAGPSAGGHAVPVVHCRREIVDRIIRGTLGKSLAEIEHEIDKDLTPQSAPIGNWLASGETNVVQTTVATKNVVGVLEATGPLADQTIVIGAHYDHLGYGEPGSLDVGHGQPAVRAIHNGADDNASGIAALIEIARRLAAERHHLKRRIVFIAFSGEERGLLGSAYYVKHPLVPLDKTIAMLNFDMVGRMKDNKLVVFGTGSAAEFDALLDRVSKGRQFTIKKNASGYGPSDQTSFYAKKIPVMHFFTGTHSDYHRPTDDSDKVNARGMRRVVELVDAIVVELAQAEQPPTYREVASAGSIAKAGDRPYFGSIPDFSSEGKGYQLSGVASGGPAAKAGLAGGDMIIQFGQSKITGLDDFDNALRQHQAGEQVKCTVRRGAKLLELKVTLDPPR